MPRKEKVDRGCAPAGTFGHMLFTARHKAGNSIAEMSRASGLSGPYLVHIERGIRSPVPNKVPAIATAYGVDPSEACWSWVANFAPLMVRHLVTYGTLEDTPFLQRHYQQYVEQVAKKEAEQADVKAERAAVRWKNWEGATQEQRAMARERLRADPQQTILDSPPTAIEPLDHQVGPRGIMSDKATQSTQNKGVK